MGLLSGLLGGVVALGCLILALRHLRRKRLIDDLPTSRAQGVFLGLTELKGTAESESPLHGYVSGAPCVAYSWRVDEQHTRTVTETYRDSKGHMQTRTRRVTEWKTVASGKDAAPFYLKDDTGVVRVVPDGANIEDVVTLDRTCTPADALYFEKGPQRELGGSDHRRRFHETALPLHATLYVMGNAREREDVVAPEIARDKSAPVFLISTRTEKQVSVAEGWGTALWVALGLMAVTIGVVVSRLSGPSATAGLGQGILIAVGAFAVLFAIGWAWMVFNSLMDLRERVRQAWSQVDVQLKWRADLIPKLVQVVDAYKGHEAQLQTLVAELRAQMAATPPGVAGPDFNGVAPAVRIAVERYPQLKANELFLKLQEALTTAEARIALARDYFNQIATFYNIRLQIIPDRLVASLVKLRPRPLLTATAFERAEVQVKLAE